MSIELRDIHKGFGEALIINHVNLEVTRGELFVLLGSSGSGKSTLLRVIAGLLSPDMGQVLINGVDITHLPPQKRNVGFVFQSYAIFKHLSVAENIEFGLRVRGAPRAERQKKRDQLLELVGLEGLGSRKPHQLSGGQRQRVALARALAYNPGVLLLDEPFGALDVKIRTQLRQSLKKIQRELGVTSILVTHDQEEAFELADRIGVLDRGNLVEVGTPAQLYHAPRTEYVATFVGGGNVMVGRAQGGKIRLGTNVLPFPAGSPAHEEGAPVRILFRPETVVYSNEPLEERAELSLLGQGVAREASFAGPIARMRFEVETLRGARPLAPELAYGQRFASIEVTQSSRGVALPTPGSRYWVGLTEYHVLEQSGFRLLAFCPEGQISKSGFELLGNLLSGSHGSARLLAASEGPHSAEQSLQLSDRLRKLKESKPQLRIDTRVRAGNVLKEVMREAQEGHFDVLILDRGGQVSEANHRELARLVRRALTYPRTPVLISPRNGRTVFERILVCTSGGEPGKEDVRFTGRLARHLNARICVFHAMREALEGDELLRIKRHLSQAQELLSYYELTSEVKLTEGEAFSTIMQELRSDPVDLVVVGASWSREQLRSPESDLVSRLVDSYDGAVLVVPAQGL